MAGQGTAALELIEDAGPLDALIVCAGGGGFLSGCAVAAKHLLPGIEVFGAEPERGNDMQQSLRSGEHRHHRRAAHHLRRPADAGGRPASLRGDPRAWSATC